MLKSRAVTVTFRFYVGLAALAVVGAVVATIGSSNDPVVDRVIGPLSVGWKGGVGDHLAYTVLLGLAVVSAFLGALFTAFRDADPSAEAQIVHLDEVPLTRASVGTNYWPVISAFGAVTMLIGLAVSSRPLALAGAVVLGAAAFMWTVRAWAERATGDDTANVELYRQLTEPLRLPILALVLVGVMVIGLSRVLLALPNTKGSAAVFGIVGTVVFVGAALVAFRPKLSRSAITLILFVFGLLVVVSGIIGAVHGSRPFEKHEPAGQQQTTGGGG
jgi:hypothetical protein